MEQKIKKSELNARNFYDYGRITVKKEHFVTCTLTEEEEDIVLSFDMEGLKPICDIREEKEENRLLLLADAMKLPELMKDYCFDLDPEQLYYDANHTVKTAMRDVYLEGECIKEEEILKQEKALCAYVMQKKYTYEDFYEGGMDLLKRNKTLKEIYGKESVEELKKYLCDEREKILQKKAEKVREVNKTSYLVRSIMAVVFPALTVLLAGFDIWYYTTAQKLQTVLLEADRDYIAGDSISMIDKMAALSVGQMDTEHKFILAQAYIKSEDLTMEQKENILAAFTLTGNEKMMEYWIHIGRLEVEEAENIAMQYSDNELLLYAYMKDKALTEGNTQMDGAEKQKKLSDLDGMIEKLAENYTVEE